MLGLLIEIQDIVLSRYALLPDSDEWRFKKSVIAQAQTYFAGKAKLMNVEMQEQFYILVRGMNVD